MGAPTLGAHAREVNGQRRAAGGTQLKAGIVGGLAVRADFGILGRVLFPGQRAAERAQIVDRVPDFRREILLLHFADHVWEQCKQRDRVRRRAFEQFARIGGAVEPVAVALKFSSLSPALDPL